MLKHPPLQNDPKFVAEVRALEDRYLEAEERNYVFKKYGLPSYSGIFSTFLYGLGIGLAVGAGCVYSWMTFGIPKNPTLKSALLYTITLGAVVIIGTLWRDLRD